MSASSENKKHVVIIGAGFAGLEAARALAEAPVKITLLDRQNYHLFQPLLYQVATAGLSPEDIAHPVRAILRKQRNLEFRQVEVTDFDVENQAVITSNGAIRYDFLIVACGSTTNYFGLQSVAKNSFGLKSIDEAITIRNHVLRNFELAAQEDNVDVRRAMMTFAVVGGGPTGVELAGAFSELIYTVLKKDYPTLNFKDARIILLEASDKVLPAMPEKLREATAEILWQKKVEVRFGGIVTDFDGKTISLKGGEMIPARSLIWAAGVKAADIIDKLGAKQGSLTRAVVTSTLQMENHPEIFVVGDAAHIDENGRPLPMTAVVALQSGRQAAINIVNIIKGQNPAQFVFNDLGTLATIGRNAAVGQIGSLQISGMIAWLLWTFIHIWRLVGFRNRIFVFWRWFWDYIFFDRSVRLITRE